MSKRNFRTIVITMCITLIISLFPGIAFAESENNANNSTEKETVQLSMENPEVFVTDDGETTITLDLVEKVEGTSASTNAVSFITVGKARFRIFWDKLRSNFEGHWSMTLTNGEKIKKVTGTMIVKKDNLGPFNPEITRMDVYKNYKIGTLYANAEDVANGSYSQTDFDDLNYNTNLILQWRNFTVSSVQKDYIIPNSERQGTIRKLEIYN
ncbi:hypothetical protein AALA24_12685 [Anaerovoracaceae bacterium 42-11]